LLTFVENYLALLAPLLTLIGFYPAPQKKVERGKWKEESGKRKEERGKRKVERGKWKVESGKWKVESGKRIPQKGTLRKMYIHAAGVA